MRLERIDHVGIAVDEATLEQARGVLEGILGADPPTQETVEEQGVRTLIYRIGDAKVELVVPTDDEGPLARFLQGQGPGLHHLALEVEDLPEALAHVDSEGLELVDDEPRAGVEGSEIAFLHPKSTFGTLLELVAFPEDDEPQAR